MTARELQPPQPMRCLGCGYDLREHTEHRCPECGRAFDPAKPETFCVRPQKDGVMLLGAILAWFLVASPIATHMTVKILRPLEDAPRIVLIVGSASIPIGGLVSAYIAWRYWTILKHVRQPRLREWKAWAAFLLSFGTFSFVVTGTISSVCLFLVPY